MKIIGTENELRNFVKIARKRQLNTFIDTLDTCFDKSDEFEHISFMDENIVFEIEDEQEPDHRKQLEIEYEERINQLERENEELNHRYRELTNRIELEHIEDLVDHLNYIEKRIGEQFGELYYSYTLFNASDPFSPINEYQLSGVNMGSYNIPSKSRICHGTEAVVHYLSQEIRNAKLRLKDAERRQEEKKIKRLRWIRNGIIVSIWIALAYII